MAKKKAHLKEEILHSAARVLLKKGIEKSTMDDIAMEAGMTKGGLYWHFKNKEELIKAIFEDFYVKDLSALKMLLEKEESIRGCLRDLFKHLENTVKGFNELGILYLEYYAYVLRQNSVPDFLRTYFEEYPKIFETLIKKGIASGEFREVDKETLSYTFTMLKEGYTIYWLFSSFWREEPLSLDPLFNLLMEFLKPDQG